MPRFSSSSAYRPHASHASAGVVFGERHHIHGVHAPGAEELGHEFTPATNTVSACNVSALMAARRGELEKMKERENTVVAYFKQTCV